MAGQRYYYEEPGVARKFTKLLSQLKPHNSVHNIIILGHDIPVVCQCIGYYITKQCVPIIVFRSEYRFRD